MCEHHDTIRVNPPNSRDLDFFLLRGPRQTDATISVSAERPVKQLFLFLFVAINPDDSSSAVIRGKEDEYTSPLYEPPM